MAGHGARTANTEFITPPATISGVPSVLPIQELNNGGSTGPPIRLRSTEQVNPRYPEDAVMDDEDDLDRRRPRNLEEIVRDHFKIFTEQITKIPGVP